MYLSAYNFTHTKCMSIFSNTDVFSKYNLRQHADGLALQLVHISLVSSSFIMTFLPHIRTYVLAFRDHVGACVCFAYLQDWHALSPPQTRHLQFFVAFRKLSAKVPDFSKWCRNCIKVCCCKEVWRRKIGQDRAGLLVAWKIIPPPPIEA